MRNTRISKEFLPERFRHLFWSYHFSDIDVDKDKKTIIIQAINYGDLNHWAWLIKYYRLPVIKDILISVPASEINPRTRALVSLLFSINNFNHAQRSTH